MVQVDAATVISGSTDENWNGNRDCRRNPVRCLVGWSILRGTGPPAPVAEPPPQEVEAPPKVYLPRLEVRSTGVIILQLAVLKDQFWELSPVPGMPNREWRVGDDEYVFPWAEGAIA